MLNCYRAFMGVNIAATIYSLFAVSLPRKSMLWRLVMVLDVVLLSLHYLLLNHTLFFWVCAKT